MKLSAPKVRTAKPGRHSDGHGLSLLVQPSGARFWTLRVQVAGKRKDFGLGSYPALSLAEARDKAAEWRKAIKAGQDPRARAKEALTFKEAAEALIAYKRPGWRNAKHAAQWSSSLERFAYPKIGEKDAAAIGIEDVLAVLKPIWTQKPETASRLRQRIEAVLNYAKTIKARSGENPAAWRGNLDNILTKASKVRAVKHHAALDWREAPVLWTALARREGIAARALAFAILTVARSGEVRGAKWSEIDLEAKVWTIPGERIKAGKEHRVPLADAALTLLGEAGEPDDLLFPSPSRPGAMLSDMTLAAVLKRMGRGDITVHGFRSTFRDWAGEATGHPREVIEAALAHRLKDKAEAAYARGDLFTKRRRLMEDWAAYLARPPAEVHDIPLEPNRPAVGEPRG